MSNFIAIFFHVRWQISWIVLYCIDRLQTSNEQKKNQKIQDLKFQLHIYF